MGKTTSACEELMAQMRTYRKRLPPFDVSFWDNESPQLWWSSIEDCFAEGEDYICQLAMKLFAITPHAAACERIWSMLGWYYGKRRTRLALHKLESMQKLAAFYISNAKKELPYYGVDKTAGELRQIINEMNIFDDNDKIIPDPEDPDTVQDINEENLTIERWINLNSEEFNSNFDEEIMEIRVFIDNKDNEDNENNEDNEDNGTNENNETNEDNEDNENNEDGEEWDPEEAADRYTRD